MSTYRLRSRASPSAPGSCRRGCAPRIRAGSAESCSAPARSSASPNGQSVLPPMLLQMLTSRSMSRICPSPRSIFVRMRCSQSRAFAARRALAARLVLVEVQQVHRHPDHAGGLVHHDDRRRAEHRAGLGQRVEARLRIELVGQQHRHRRSAGDHRLELLAAANAAARTCRRRSARAASTSIDASKTPGLLTCPLTQYSFGPVFFSGPIDANHSGPFVKISGHVADASRRC